MSRDVRTTREFWAALDAAMPSGRDPSWHDFATVDLPVIVERFRQEWDDLPSFIPGRTDYRMLIGAGQVDAFYVAEAQLARDGGLELVGIEIQIHEM